MPQANATLSRPAPTGDNLLPASVLIAEDEHLIAIDLARSIKQLEIDVVGPVADGEQTIEAAKAHKPDMALLDICMPKKDGLEAMGVISRQMGIPVVIVSAFSDPAQVESATKAGAFGYLLKPTTTEKLRAALAVAWSRYNEQAQLRDQVQELKTSLADRKVIEMAKGRLMKTLGLDEPDAMSRLRKMARDARRSLADMARAILETEGLRPG